MSLYSKGLKVQAVDELGRWEEARVVNEPDSSGHIEVQFRGWSTTFNRVLDPLAGEIRTIIDPFQEEIICKYSLLNLNLYFM